MRFLGEIENLDSEKRTRIFKTPGLPKFFPNSLKISCVSSVINVMYKKLNPSANLTKITAIPSEKYKVPTEILTLMIPLTFLTFLS